MIMNSHPQEPYRRGLCERHGSHRDQVSYESREDRKSGRRTTGHQPAGSPSHERRDYYGSGPGQQVGARNRHKPIHTSFQDAMEDLHNLLIQAEQFYSHFKQEFDHETMGIKPYANQKVMKYLWTSKVARSGMPDIGHHTKSRNGYEPEDQTPREDFHSLGKKICRLLKVAITAADILQSQRPSRESKIDSSTAARICEKLKSAFAEISALLTLASKRIEDVEPLMTDLEMIATYLRRNGAGRQQLPGREELKDLEGYDDTHAGISDDGEGRSMWHEMS